jgi:hypothetical protein
VDLGNAVVTADAVHSCRETAHTTKTEIPDTPEMAPGHGHAAEPRRQLLYLAGVKQVNRTLQAIARDRTRLLDYLPL